MRNHPARRWLPLAIAVLVLGGCGSSDETDTTVTGATPETAPPGATAVETTTAPPNEETTAPGATLTLAEQTNSGTHSYSSEVEVLECGAQPPLTLFDDKLFDVVVGSDEMSYDDPNDDHPPLVWARVGPDEFAREFTTDAGEHIAYTLTLSEEGMVYYYDIDSVPCRRITWTLIDE